ncbi:F-box and wd40 domain protein [Reticulomyxa filosa]|uniref:F-box and wd40 domain protein n=1 Tax=Reticulomyxa filosa TaxID=46433 RepID=X6NFI3_RETFI|nr:F-box and wd40 domain protein [Reticulomyxa filosa]|eukprot:ETO24102.1 F-box and wd40 domain protein [Reticulomyxa filosa]
MFIGHIVYAWSIDYSSLDDCQLICSGSDDKTIRIWDIDTNEQIQFFNRYSSPVYCERFSPYHYHCSVIFSSSLTIPSVFGVLKVINNYKDLIRIKQYLCSGSFDVETYKSLHIFNENENTVLCVDFSPLQSNNNSTNGNSVGVIGGNGYTICSGSYKTIRKWDIKITYCFQRVSNWMKNKKKLSSFFLHKRFCIISKHDVTFFVPLRKNFLLKLFGQSKDSKKKKKIIWPNKIKRLPQRKLFLIQLIHFVGNCTICNQFPQIIKPRVIDFAKRGILLALATMPGMNWQSTHCFVEAAIHAQERTTKKTNGTLIWNLPTKTFLFTSPLFFNLIVLYNSR